MLKYQFKAYYPENLLLSECSFIGEQYNTDHQYFYNGISVRGIRDPCYSFKLYLLSSKLSLISPINNIQSGFDTIFNKISGYKELTTSRPTSYMKMHIALTNVMFLEELSKNQNLLNDEVFIKIHDRHFIDFKSTKGYSLYFNKDNLRFDKYTNLYVLQAEINKLYRIISSMCIVFKDGVNDCKYKKIMILYLKCAIICAEKCYKYISFINEARNKISGIKQEDYWSRYNSIKRLNSHIIGIEDLRMSQILFYSKSFIEANKYLYLKNNIFISSLDTYSNVESLDRKDTVIGIIDKYLEDNQIKYKVVISKEIIEYFSFLKKRKKEDSYISDYNKLNKALNAIKSLATLKEVEIEISEIEDKIYSIELSVDDSTISDILGVNSLRLIPKNINHALEIKSVFDDIKNSWDYLSDFCSEHTVEDSYFASSNVFNKTKKVEEKIDQFLDIPF